MKQMRSTAAPVFARGKFGTVNGVFMRDRSGKIFFLQAGRNSTLPFPVLEDGTLGETANLAAIPSAAHLGFEIELIHWKILDITDFDEWLAANRRADPTAIASE